MKATKITNFRGIKFKETDLTKLNLVVGRNGTGKSSFLDALRTLLTGAPETNSPLMKGEHNGSVYGQMEDGTEIEVVYSEKDGKLKTTTKIGGSGVAKNTAVSVREGIGKLPIGILSILMGPKEGFLNMKAADFGSLLMQILPFSKDREELLTASGFSEDEKSYLSPMLPEKMTFDAIKDGYGELYSRRKVQKQEYDRMKVEIETATASKPALSKVAIHTKLNAAQQRKVSENDYQQKLAEHEASKAEYQKAMEELKQLSQSIVKVEKPSEMRVLAYQTKSKTLQSALQNTLNNIKALNSEMEVIKRNVEVNKKVLADLETNVCPISSKLLCMTDKTAVRSEIERSVHEMTDLLSSKEKQLETLLKQEAQQKQELEDNEKSFTDEYTKRMTLYVEYLKKVDAYERKRSSIQPVKPAPKPVTLGTTNVDEEISDLSKQLVKLENYEKANADLPKLKILEDELEMLNALVTDFAPKGRVYNALLALSVNLQEKYLNDRAKEIGLPIELKMEAENGMNLLVKTNGTDFIPVSDISEGERFLTQFLFLDLCCAMSGCRYMILDNADALDAQSLDKVIEFISQPSVLKAYDGIFIAGLDHDDTVSVINKHIGSDISVIQF